MIILIDFENTHASGFQGVEYLDEKDTLVVYYSDENSAVSKGLVEDLRQKNVHVRMVKLLKQHSNALDMYIASTTGMFLDCLKGQRLCRGERFLAQLKRRGNSFGRNHRGMFLKFRSK